MSTGDTFTLRVPRGESYRALLHLVLGGIASRRGISFDALEDVQLAVDNLLAEDMETCDELQMRVALDDDLLCITLEMLKDAYLRANLTHEALPAGMANRRIDMSVLLDSLVDGYLVQQGAAGMYSVQLRKRIL